MNQCTENYECLVIDNTSTSNRIEDCVYWYKGDAHPPFKLGAPEFWQYHNNNYSEGADNDDDAIDINDIKKKNAVAVSVNKTH
jgi:hypothetical protein